MGSLRSKCSRREGAGGTEDDFWGSKNVINTGRWSYVPIATKPSAPERNGYGRITDRMNADPAEFLTRGASEVCGVRSKKRLPGCNELHAVMGSKNLEQLDHNVEYEFHGYIHMLLGGAVLHNPFSSALRPMLTGRPPQLDDFEAVRY